LGWIPHPPAERSETVFSYQRAVFLDADHNEGRKEKIARNMPKKNFFWQFSKTGQGRQGVAKRRQDVTFQLHGGKSIVF
jgi:hypothetical protein